MAWRGRGLVSGGRRAVAHPLHGVRLRSKRCEGARASSGGTSPAREALAGISSASPPHAVERWSGGPPHHRCSGLEELLRAGVQWRLCRVTGEERQQAWEWGSQLLMGWAVSESRIKQAQRIGKEYPN